jgi:mono/diheme cytochrome c family protein
MSDEVKSSTPPATNEPTATHSTVPIWIFVVMLALLYLGFVYFDHNSGWFSATVYGPYTSAEQLDSYEPKSGAEALKAHGKSVFEMYCGSCHGNDGMGKPNQAPPLAGSEWVNAKGFERLAKIPLEGLNGTFQVEGKDWSLNMAPMGAGLSDGDLAAVLTYIRGSWGNKGGEVTSDDVKAIRAKIGAHPTAVQADQLKSMPE